MSCSGPLTVAAGRQRFRHWATGVGRGAHGCRNALGASPSPARAYRECAPDALRLGRAIVTRTGMPCPSLTTVVGAVRPGLRRPALLGAAIEQGGPALTSRHPLRMVCWSCIAAIRGHIPRDQQAQPCDCRSHSRDAWRHDSRAPCPRKSCFMAAPKCKSGFTERVQAGNSRRQGAAKVLSPRRAAVGIPSPQGVAALAAPPGSRGMSFHAASADGGTCCRGARVRGATADQGGGAPNKGT